MRRKLFSVLLTVIAFAAAASAATYARSAMASSPAGPALPVFSEVPLTLSDTTKATINNAIGELAGTYGVTTTSLSQVRGLSVDGDTLYVVPGSGTNVCLVFRGGAACGAPDSSKHLIALFVANTDGVLAGGGVIDGTPSHISFTASSGARSASDVSNGAFVLSSSADLYAVRGQPLQIDPQ